VAYAGPALEAGIYHIAVFSLDGSSEAMSDVVPLEVIGSDAAP
jgi:hypothetical protein